MLGGLEHRTLATVVARAYRTALGSAVASASLLTVNPAQKQDIGALVNAAIDAMLVVSPNGGTVRIPDGAFFVETTILQKSGIHLLLNPGTTLIAKTGLNAPVIQNATAITEKTITGITNAARVATATCIAHGYVVGDWVHVSGASPDGYNGWHKVITAPTADTFTYYVDKNIVADSGVISVFKVVDSNLKISGGKIVGNALNNVGDNNGVKYEGVKDFEIESLVVDGTYNNAVSIFGAVAGKLFRVRADNVISATHNGILLGASSTVRYVEDITLVACEGNGCGQDGILYERGRNIRGFGNGGKFNGLCAIKIGKCEGVREIGSWGRYNTANGLQIQPSGTGSRDITVALGDFCENGESGIFVGNSDTANPFVNLELLQNQCHRNGQIASATAYGIAFEVSASATVDRVTVEGNHLDDQGRGLSFGAAGTVSNASIRGNRAKGNTSDANFGASLQAATLEYGFNKFANVGGNGIVLSSIYLSSFPQIVAKSIAKATAPADTNNNTLATIPVPAGVLGAGGMLVIECVFSFTNSVNNKTMTVDFDGSVYSNVTDTNQLTSRVKITIQNDGAANAQRVFIERMDGSTMAAGATTSGIDTSLAKSINLKAQKASAGESIVLESYSVLALVTS